MINLKIRAFWTGLVLFSATLSASAYTSAWNNIAVVGDFTKWDSAVEQNLELIDDNLWQGEFHITTASNRFKFLANKTWDIQWITTNQPPYTEVPLTLMLHQTNNIWGGDIGAINMQPGFYRITFNESSGYFRWDLLYTDASGINLASNASFEVQGSTNYTANCWEWDHPDTHGDHWNDASKPASRPHRENWRAHSGSWEATIRGQWQTWMEDFGGWWREGPATPGLTYEASAWFWADDRAGNYWSADSQELKIEFYDAGFVQLDMQSLSFPDLTGEVWYRKSIRAVAPPDTAWARIVIAASGIGNQGALQFDDVQLRSIATSSQDFKNWGTFTNTDACHTFDDWMICTGKTTAVNARSGYCASLPWTAGSSNHVRSARIEDGLGTISFWYRHGSTDTNEEPTSPVGFIVEKSPDASTWTTVAERTNILTLSYVKFTIYEYEPTPYYFRIRHIGGSTNRLLIDDILVEEPSEVPRYQDFNDWPDDTTNMGCHTWLQWSVCSGRVWDVNAKEGKSALLQGTSTGTNYIRSPFLSDGYGSISFYYARGTNGSGAANLHLEASANGINWTTIGGVTNITATSYSQFSQFFIADGGAYIRICNVTSETAVGETLLLEEHFDDGSTPPPGWTFNGVSTYTSDTSSGDNPDSIKFDSNGDNILTAALNNPTNLQFWLKGVGTSSYTNHFLVETAAGGTWTTITNISPLPTTEHIYSMPLQSSVTNIRFTYQKVYGNAALDDIYIHGLPQSGAPPQDLLIDQINIAYPILNRLQDFNSWPTENSYGNYEYQGWTVVDAIVNDGKAYEGQSARLNSTVGTHPRIQTPWMPEGIGSISFQYARYSTTTGSNPTYRIQTSVDGSTWTNIDTIAPTPAETAYQEYSTYLYETNSHYVRIYHEAGSASAVLFDNVYVQKPVPPANVIINGWNDPTLPSSNDEVRLWANILPQYGAGTIMVTSYYRIGTSGAFTAMTMSLTNLVNYVTDSAIAAQTIGTVVQYYMACTYIGTGAELTRPMYYPEDGSNAPAHYAIPREPSGQVWINELNYINGLGFYEDTNEFVELCGPEGFDLSGWQINLYVSDSDSNQYSYYASYTLPHGTVLSNDADGYGFFVLSDSNIPAMDMLLTNVIDVWDNQIANGDYPSGVQLLNEGGGIEQNISYRGPIEGFDRIYAEEDFWFLEDPYGLQLTGTGTSYGDFSWSTNQYTPGAKNDGQTFGEPVGLPTNIWILSFTRSSQMRIACQATNGWNPEVWYTASLASPQSWTLIGTRTITTNAGTWYIDFAEPVGGVNYLFRVEMKEP